jgi:hypothetical protein
MEHKKFNIKYENTMQAVIILLSGLAAYVKHDDIKNEIEVIREQFDRGLITAGEAVGKMNDILEYYDRAGF